MTRLRIFLHRLLGLLQLGSRAEWFKENTIELNTLGRLKPGVTRRQADSHLDILVHGVAQLNPSGNERIMFYVVSEIEGPGQRPVRAASVVVHSIFAE
jgi:hypothetical protein